VQDPRLARLDRSELDLLSRYRILTPEDQLYIQDLIESLVSRRLSRKPQNVYLLADPGRKFTGSPPPQAPLHRSKRKPEVA
jgi:hypothetical protein